ncbi:MAG: alginate lyase family protein [Defluviitaleaceae bacterium]|nr:alginate lyase family protein [Defluviitaleaceae bacterium]MCL2836319.1 alginate lyase family protein [Defluviitaleaceae bacterium]
MLTFVNRDTIDDLKRRLTSATGEYAYLRFEMEQAAAVRFAQGPRSVTCSKSGAVSGNPHDYYSIGPYWWPDPNADDPKTAPYIRRDGEVNPEYNDCRHKQDFDDLSIAVHTLVTAGFYLSKRAYLDRAAELIHVWFLNEETKMNPHLEYAQAIQGICAGRGIGIIELSALDRIVHSLGYLEEAGGYEQLIAAFNMWLNQMLDWLLTSKNGIDESKNGNNHETYYWMRAGLYGFWLGRPDSVNLMCKNYTERIIPLQIEPDGAMIRELGRTRSLRYSLYNLDAMAMTCEIARVNGVDLWRFNDGERSIETAIRYLIPALKNPYDWRFREISSDVPPDTFAMQFAALRLNRPDLTAINRLRRDQMRLWRYQAISPPALLEGYS